MIPMFIVALCFTSLGWMGCSNDSEVYPDTSGLVNDVRAQRLASSMLEIMENKTSEYTQNGFIVSVPESDSLLVCDGRAYMMGSLLSGIMNPSPKNASFAPKGDGWIYAGTCNWVSAVVFARKLSKQIPSGVQYEIHVEPQGDGTYKVWYRIVK